MQKVLLMEFVDLVVNQSRIFWMKCRNSCFHKIIWSHFCKRTIICRVPSSAKTKFRLIIFIKFSCDLGNLKVPGKEGKYLWWDSWTRDPIRGRPGHGRYNKLRTGQLGQMVKGQDLSQTKRFGTGHEVEKWKLIAENRMHIPYEWPRGKMDKRFYHPLKGGRTENIPGRMDTSTEENYPRDSLQEMWVSFIQFIHQDIYVISGRWRRYPGSYILESHAWVYRGKASIQSDLVAGANLQLWNVFNSSPTENCNNCYSKYNRANNSMWWFRQGKSQLLRHKRLFEHYWLLKSTF